MQDYKQALAKAVKDARTKRGLRGRPRPLPPHRPDQSRPLGPHSISELPHSFQKDSFRDLLSTPRPQRLHPHWSWNYH